MICNECTYLRYNKEKKTTVCHVRRTIQEAIKKNSCPSFVVAYKGTIPPTKENTMSEDKTLKERLDQLESTLHFLMILVIKLQQDTSYKFTLAHKQSSGEETTKLQELFAANDAVFNNLAESYLSNQTPPNDELLKMLHNASKLLETSEDE